MNHIPSSVGISSSYTQRIPLIVLTPKIQYSVNKNTPLHPISILSKSVLIITTYFFRNFATASRMWSGNLKERYHVAYVAADGKIILK
jgi:hypothetical protein